MGLFARASSLAVPGKTAGGLLRRSLAILHSLVGAPRSPALPLYAVTAALKPAGTAVTAEELAYRVAAIPKGFAGPILLFALLKEALGLSQAALLAYDPRRHVYSPLAAVGFDTTSRHRLRLEPGANPEFNRAAAGRIVEVRGEELAAFREYFSSREFSAVRELTLVPYLHAQRLVGLLLVTRMRRPSTGDALELLRSTMMPAGELLPQDEESEAAEDARPLAERLESLLAGCKNRGHPLILIRLSLDEPVRLAREHFPDLEGFRLYEFLVGACRRLLRGIGQVEMPKPKDLILLVHGMKDGDPPLLLRQVEIALLAQLRGLVDANSVDLRAEVRTVTDDAQAALEFLSP
jgi:hypothetical protein